MSVKDVFDRNIGIYMQEKRMYSVSFYRNFFTCRDVNGRMVIPATSLVIIMKSRLLKKKGEVVSYGEPANRANAHETLEQGFSLLMAAQVLETFRAKGYHCPCSQLELT